MSTIYNPSESGSVNVGVAAVVVPDTIISTEITLVASPTTANVGDKINLTATLRNAETKGILGAGFLLYLSIDGVTTTGTKATSSSGTALYEYTAQERDAGKTISLKAHFDGKTV